MRLGDFKMAGTLLNNWSGVDGWVMGWMNKQTHLNIPFHKLQSLTYPPTKLRIPIPFTNHPSIYKPHQPKHLASPPPPYTHPQNALLNQPLNSPIAHQSTNPKYSYVPPTQNSPKQSSHPLTQSPTPTNPQTPNTLTPHPPTQNKTPLTHSKPPHPNHLLKVSLSTEPKDLCGLGQTNAGEAG